MFLLKGRAEPAVVEGRPERVVVTSASDLTLASHCEWHFVRALDGKLGLTPPVVEEPDAMLERTARLGDAHEARVLERYRERYGDGVVEIARPEAMTDAALSARADETLLAFEAGADVVFQATFWDGSFVGFADFIVRQPDGSYEIQDSKLARSARITALLQLAAYAEKLEALGARSSAGIRVSPVVRLLLGDGSESEHLVSDIAPVYRRRRARLERIVAERAAADDAVRWGDPRYAICGRCALCEAEVQAHRDLLLVAGLSVRQRQTLRSGGIDTIEALAAASDPPEGMPRSTFEHLREQARVQIESVPDAAPVVHVVAPGALAAIPEPSDGDVFFDFEGDPLYSEPGLEGRTEWGLDYLFGLVERDGAFRAFWAHDFAEERAALLDFLSYLRERRSRHPDLHVYHYAPYERTHLLSLAARHGVGEEEVDALLRDHVLVDLYPVVRQALRVGSRSYSIKRLEPLYMGEEHRDGEVTTAGDSIMEYAVVRQLRAEGLHAEAQRVLDEIADYNRYDCVSTLRLRDWLLSIARERGVRPLGARTRDELVEIEPSPLHDALRELAGDPLDPARTPDQAALGVAAAAIDYHRREQKSFWWAHFARLVDPIDEWADTRDVLRIERASLERDWYREGRQRSDRREILVSGSWAPGSSVRPGAQPYAVYAHPGPWTEETGDPGARVARTVTVLEANDDGTVLLRETLRPGVPPYDAMPVALTPAAPPRPGTQVDAIAWWGEGVVSAVREQRAAGVPLDRALPADPVLDLLRRLPPRTDAAALPDTGDRVADVTAALLRLDGSSLAVQGPPGTGKTYLASHVIAALVREHGWRIGVVAQSHAVVENVLERVVAAGVPADRVAKTPKAGGDPEREPSFTVLRPNGHLVFALDHAEHGFVLGGTAWDFSNPARFERRSLDLLVVDEAGQYSLGSTIAASVAARNLLLLGDPQQLPQVSQGTHPEPVDASALGWVGAGHDVLPSELGYFLAESRRMDEAVTSVVSELSYAGELRSHPSTADRRLEGVEPGLHLVPVEHTGNATSSPEEAEHVVRIVRSLVGLRWTDPAEDAERTPLTDADVIVVSPYNAHVSVLREALDAAGLTGTRVGTVDRFQGQEAVISIVSLAASDASEVPRGMGFLLMRNRLNVSISRAKWAAYLVCSPALTEYLPQTPAELAQLSAFIRLTESARG